MGSTVVFYYQTPLSGRFVNVFWRALLMFTCNSSHKREELDYKRLSKKKVGLIRTSPGVYLAYIKMK